MGEPARQSPVLAISLPPEVRSNLESKRQKNACENRARFVSDRSGQTPISPPWLEGAKSCMAL